jgi:hypothetical protein
MELLVTYAKVPQSYEGHQREHMGARCWWLTPVILATQEAEIRRIEVQNQPWQ